MEVQIISKTAQKFNGETFYLCGLYYQHKGKRLHRAVWEAHNGEIPDGYHIHHKDKNRENNQIENLELVAAAEHLSRHMSDPSRVEESRQSIKNAAVYAKQWHGSKAGAEWHSEHAREYWEKAPMRTYECSFCGKSYQSKSVRHNGNHFCCNNCKAAYRRRKTREG